jgi:hypothetical protein
MGPIPPRLSSVHRSGERDARHPRIVRRVVVALAIPGRFTTGIFQPFIDHIPFRASCRNMMIMVTV